MVLLEDTPNSILTLSVVALLTLVLSHWWWNNKRSGSTNSAPSPPEMPIIGTHLHLAIKHLASPKGHEFMADMHNKYGPVVELRLPDRKLGLVSNPNTIRRMWASSEFHRNEILQQNGKTLFKYPLFALPTGPDWQRHRKLLQPVFAPANLRSTTLRTQEIYKSLFGKWKTLIAKGTNVDSQRRLRVSFSRAAKAVVVDTIGQIAFSHDFEAVNSFLNGKDCEGIQPINEMMKMMQKRIGIPEPMWFMAGISANGSEAVRIRNTIETFLKGIVDRKKDTLASREREENGSGGDETKLKEATLSLKWDLDIVDRLLIGTGANGEKFSDEEVIDETIGFFLAGLDTTSRTLESLFMKLGQEKLVRERLAEEVGRVLPTLDEGPIQLADLNKFEYLENVIKESMRTDPIVGSFPRCAAQEVEVEGYTFPKDTIFFLNVLVANKQEEYWKDPLTFNPDRFKNVDECKAFIPFGDGPTTCIGQKLAMLQLKLFTILFFSYFDFEIVPGQSFEKETSLTLGMGEPLELLLSLRK